MGDRCRFPEEESGVRAHDCDLRLRWVPSALVFRRGEDDNGVFRLFFLIRFVLELSLSIPEEDEGSLIDCNEPSPSTGSFFLCRRSCSGIIFFGNRGLLPFPVFFFLFFF